MKTTEPATTVTTTMTEDTKNPEITIITIIATEITGTGKMKKGNTENAGTEIVDITTTEIVAGTTMQK